MLVRAARGLETLLVEIGFAIRRLTRRSALAGGEPRSAAQLREHYLIEKELADRLRNAPREARPSLYTQVYDELFRRVTHHPQLRARRQLQDAGRRLRKVEQQLRVLRPHLRPNETFLEIGAGDCSLSLRAAAFAGKVYAVEVSEQITSGLRPPKNFELRLTAGARVPVADGAAHFAFSDQLMEHLHPEDAADQIREIHRALASGGKYLCITPNRLYGPRDISAHFDDVATGLHLKEYSASELRRLFLDNGFSVVRFYAGARGFFVRFPYPVIAAMERALEALPRRWRRRLADCGPLRAILGVRALAIK